MDEPATPTSEPPDWVPPLILMADHGHSWQSFVAAVYAVFRRDFIASQPRFRGKYVRCRRDPIYDGKEAAFWHCTSEGRTEDERIPDIRRCERIEWVRAIIENCLDKRIDTWETDKRGDLRCYLWFNEEFLVALGNRARSWQLITAFCTEREHNKRKLRQEREECQNG